jgi:nucleotidyltransferase substrate binding protein (TIGR01987 family)
MTNPDIRWKQRYHNFCLAYSQLQKFIEKGELNEFEEQGLIQSFEYNFELAWNTIKDYYEYQGETNIQGSKDAIRLAFKRGLITDGAVWLDMLASRVLTSHTYQKQTAQQVIHDIREKYVEQFSLFLETMSQIVREN